jgi:endonuclease/exonuclease/phosphatase family metal-dependent hydrolase
MSAKSAITAADINLGYIPEKKFGKCLSGDFVIWDPMRRDLACQALTEPDGHLPDILCLQEVENMDALRKFNEDHLGHFYQYHLLIDGRDPRNIDVAVLSRFPITRVRSHLDEVNGTGSSIFSRDCLEVTVALDTGEELTLFVNHLKSKFVDTRNKATADMKLAALKSHRQRLAQAAKVANYVEERFKGQHGTALYAVIGDFNDTEESPWVAPLLQSPLLVDVVAQTRPVNDRWTYYWCAQGRVQQIDHVLASKALAARVTMTHIERTGLAYRALNRAGETLPKEVTVTHFEDDGVTPKPSIVTADEKVPFGFGRYAPIFENVGNNISDHCPVKVWF